MKIGVLTFHCVNNYGAVLQAHALADHISKLGHQIGLVNYRPSYLVDKYILFSKERMGNSKQNKLSFLAKEAIKLKGLKKKNYLFSKFRDSKFNLTELSQVSDLDFVVLGSDQIWNTKLTNGVDDYFFGGFAEGPKYISYAASMEARIDDDEVALIGDKLRDLNQIAVREESLAVLIKEKYNIDTTVVVDPVFLLNKRDWAEFSDSYDIKEPFVFVYYFGLTDEILDIIRKFAKDRGLRVVLTSVNVVVGKEAINDVSPEQFVWLIANAQFVFTNSFHGTSFCLLMETPFLSVKKANSKNERISNILNKANQNFRFATKDELDSLDYESFTQTPSIENTELDNDIKRSKSYLLEAFLDS